MLEVFSLPYYRFSPQSCPRRLTFMGYIKGCPWLLASRWVNTLVDTSRRLEGRRGRAGHSFCCLPPYQIPKAAAPVKLTSPP